MTTTKANDDDRGVRSVKKTKRRREPTKAKVATIPARPKAKRSLRRMPDRPARIGVISPAGKVINHNDVLTYAYGDPEKSIRQFMNIGDAFVYDSSLKILDFAELVPV